MGRAPWQHWLYASMCGQPAGSRLGQVGLAALWLGSVLYGAVARGRQASYAAGIRRKKRLPCRVVSIGNVTVGGTGKTPLTMWVARWYQEHGWRVAVLSRGYGAHTALPLQVVSSGHGPLADWQTVGDEPYLMARSLPGIPVLVGKNRYLSGRYACEHFGTQIVVLDDGFQHCSLSRDLDVVLLDASNPFGHGALLPRGILREPLSALRRADAIVLTRVDLAAPRLPALRQQVCHYSKGRPIYGTAMAAEALWQSTTGVVESVAPLQGSRVVAFAGIGNPQAFVKTLQQLGSEVAALFVFPDHYCYTVQDWQVIMQAARQQQATCLVTTEKDAVRFPASWEAEIPVYALRIGMRFFQGEPALPQQLSAVMTYA